MPIHNHNLLAGYDTGVNGSDAVGYNSTNQGARSYQYRLGNSNQLAIADKGGGQAHNNLQPYTTVYMYRRTK